MEMLDDGAKSKGRKERQRADQNHDSNQKRYEGASVRWERACGCGNQLLASQISGNRQERQDHKKPSDEHGKSDSQVVERRVRGDSAKADPLFPVADEKV